MTLIVHPGFHKTGTSWLQEQVFSDRRFFNPLLDHREIDLLLVRPHDFAFSSDAAKKRLSEVRRMPARGIAEVLSSEILCGNPLNGARDSKVLATRIKSVCEDAKILLTVRSQVATASSVYLQYIKRGGRLGIREFLKREPQPGYYWFDHDTLKFDILTNYYASLFGKESVLVLPQELLVKDPESYLRHLFSFSGVTAPSYEEITRRPEVGTSPSAGTIPLIRLGNLFRRSAINPEALSSLHLLGHALLAVSKRVRFGERRARLALDSIVRDHLKGKYGQSNLRLQKYVPCELKPLGYEFEEE